MLALCVVAFTSCAAPVHASEGLPVAAQGRVAEPVEIDDVKDGFDVSIGIAQVVASLVTVGSVIFLLLQLRATKEQIGLLSEQVRQTRAEAPVLPRSPRDPRAPSASKNDVLQIFDFFEAVGTAYNKGQIDRDTLLRSFGSTPVQMYVVGWWFLCWRRGGVPASETRLYEQFTEMVRALRVAEPKLQDLVEPSRVRLLALPASADHWDWKLCARFSDLVSRRLRSISVGEAITDATCVALEHPKQAGVQFFSRIILVPGDVDLDTAQWQRECSEAAKLMHQLRGLDAVTMERVVDRLETRWVPNDEGPPDGGPSGEAV